MIRYHRGLEEGSSMREGLNRCIVEEHPVKFLSNGECMLFI